MDYTNQSEKEIIAWLEKNLTEEKLFHALGCAKCARELAKKFDLDFEKAYLAGLLHDCAKCFKKEDMLKIAHDIDIDKEEIHNYKVLHAPVSAYIAKTLFGVEDKDILSSIRWHTLGYVGMSKFEKIVFLADKIEPNTRKEEFSSKIIEKIEIQKDLDSAILDCYKYTINSLVKRNLTIHQSTIDIYNAMVKD